MEAYAGLVYVHEHGDELHVDGNNIIIMGESAGGWINRAYGAVEQGQRQRAYKGCGAYLSAKMT